MFTSASETPDECAISSVIEKPIKDGVFLDDHLFGLRIKREYRDKVYPSFLKYAFRAESFRSQMKKAVRGVTRFYVAKPAFLKLTIPVPPIEVQREIVRILDNFTELTVELTAELEARKKQYEYYRDKLLNFSKLHIDQPGGVRLMALGEIGSVCMCKRVLKSETSAQGDVPFYKIGTFGKQPDAYISQSKYEEYKRLYSFPRKGEVLLSAAGTIGRAVIYDGAPAYYQDSNIVWISNDESVVLNKYLFYCYSLKPWNVSKGGTIARLYNNDLAQAKIKVPSLAEQERIVSTLDKFDALVNDLSSGLPAELAARRQQYEYYRDRLLTFKEIAS